MLKIHAFLLLANLWTATALRIALIGGGIGSASTALHLRELIPDDLEIDVYEKSNRLGGRASSITLDKQVIELGASIVHQDNKIIAKMAKIANLTLAPPQGSESGLFALFDGASLVFRESSWRIITLIKLLWHYGLQPWYYKNTAADFLARFKEIYTLQDRRIAFTRPHDLLRNISCFYLTQMTFTQFIQDTYHQYSRFASEMVAAASKVNYNQANIELNALAGLVSLLPATDPRVFKIKEGNEKLVSGALEAAGAKVHLNSAVSAIEGLPDGSSGFKISGSSATSPASFNENYDLVVIAAPLQLSGITIIGIDHLPVIPHRDYRTTIVTIIKGAIQSTFFGLPMHKMPYDSVLVTESGASVPFNSISKVGTATGFKAIYKIFSSKPMPEAWLSMLFEKGYEVMVNATWYAYPQFDPPENFPPFELSKMGLYYVNAWESAASALEMSAVAGRNVALLIAQKASQLGSNVERSSIASDKLGRTVSLRAERGGSNEAVAAAA